MTNDELTIIVTRQDVKLEYIIKLLEERKAGQEELRKEVAEIQRKVNYAAAYVLGVSTIIGLFLNTILRKMGLVS